MTQHLVLTAISPDRPGIVQLLAQTINDHGGNWLESRMTELAGQFAGILQVTVAEEHQAALISALEGLSDEGLQVTVQTAEPATPTQHQGFEFTVMGADRTGIVFEISQAFAQRSISVDELETDTSSMPWSGEPMFQARGMIHVPGTVDMDDLMDQLDNIGDELAVDIRIEEPQE